LAASALLTTGCGAYGEAEMRETLESLPFEYEFVAGPVARG